MNVNFRAPPKSKLKVNAPFETDDHHPTFIAVEIQKSINYAVKNAIFYRLKIEKPEVSQTQNRSILPMCGAYTQRDKIANQSLSKSASRMNPVRSHNEWVNKTH
jgi:hypothetical protein